MVPGILEIVTTTPRADVGEMTLEVTNLLRPLITIGNIADDRQ